MCFVFPFILDVRLVDVPAGGHTGGRSHRISPPLPSAGLTLFFLARRIQPLLALVDREVYRILCTNELIVLDLLGIFFNVLFLFFLRGKIPVRVTAPRIRTHVLTSEGFEVTN